MFFLYELGRGFMEAEVVLEDPVQKAGVVVLFSASSLEGTFKSDNVKGRYTRLEEEVERLSCFLRE